MYLDQMESHVPWKTCIKQTFLEEMNWSETSAAVNAIEQREWIARVHKTETSVAAISNGRNHQ